MMREAAEATLSGQVNDWVAAAQRHAADVVSLIDGAAAAAAAHKAEVETLTVNIAALEARLAVTVTAASEATADAAAAREHVGRLEAVVASYRTLAAHLNAQIVEHADNVFTFAYGSRGAIEGFRKAMVD